MRLKGIRSALKKYPTALIQKYLKAVFISGIIKIFNVQGSGTYLHSWVYVSAIPEYEPLGPQVYEKTFHHELSSLLLNGADFPADQWSRTYEVTFKYLERQIDIINAAAIESRHDPKNAPSWHQAGFVHDYGMVSMENDFNMYVELAMTHPQRLKELAQEYLKIKAKTQILVGFYTRLAPELGAYFKSAGLVEEPAMKSAH